MQTTSDAPVVGQAVPVLQYELGALDERGADERDEAPPSIGSVYAAAPIGLAFLNRDLRFVHVNEAFARMTGVVVDAHIGARLSELLPEVAQIRDVEAEWRRLLETGGSRLEVDVSVVTPAASKDRRFWAASWYAVREQGQIIGVGVVVRDITRRTHEEQLRRLVLGLANHDLRAPIMAVTMSAEALRVGGELAARQTTALERMLASVARVEKAVGDLIDMTRVAAGERLEIVPRPVSLKDLCEEWVEAAQVAHRIHVFRAECSPDVNGEWDAASLGRVVGNLLARAVRHSPPDAPIIVRCAGAGEAVTIDVENQGPSIIPELLVGIFEPFYGDERDPIAGLGLGLLIAREIVAAHGGSISVDSTEVRTVFRVRLPRRSAARSHA